MIVRRLASLLAFTLLTCTLAAGTATAQTGPPSAFGACGGIKPAGGGIDLGATFRCSCTGGELVFSGTSSIPGTTVSGGYTSGAGLTCTSYVVKAEYDSYESDGSALVVEDEFQENLLFTASCDTSDCGQFLWFLWSVGSAQCSWADGVKSGGHMSYKIVGQCPERVARTGYASPYGPLVIFSASTSNR